MTDNSWQSVPNPGAAGEPGGPPEDPFFASIRSSGWYRAEPRWLAGVCSGISARTGWDVRLVRGILLVATLLTWVPLILYGVAWLLLPDGRGGRIEAQLALRGTFDWPQLWAALMVGIGLFVLPGSFFWGFSMLAVWWVLVIAATVVLVVYFSSKEGTRQQAGDPERVVPMSTPNQDPYAPRGAQTPPPAPQGQYRATQTAAGTYQQGLYYSPKPQRMAPKIGNLVGFLTVGVLFIIASGGMFLMFQGGVHAARVVLGTIGLIVLITGAVLAWGALTGRRGGWFLGFSIGGALLLLPATAIGMGVASGLAYSQSHEVWEDDIAVEEAYVEELPGSYASGEVNVNGGFAAVGNETGVVNAQGGEVLWDLTESPNADSGDIFYYSLEAYDSKVTILATAAQLPSVNVDGTSWDSTVVVRSEDPAVTQALADRWANSGFSMQPVAASSASVIELSLAATESDVTIRIITQDQANQIHDQLSVSQGKEPWQAPEETPAASSPDTTDEAAQSGAESAQSGNQ